MVVITWEATRVDIKYEPHPSLLYDLFALNFVTLCVCCCSSIMKIDHIHNRITSMSTIVPSCSSLWSKSIVLYSYQGNNYTGQ